MLEGSQVELLANLAVQAWSRLGPDRPLPTRVGPVKKNPKRRTSVFRLDGVGPGGGAVIAKRCKPFSGPVERVVYEEYLPHLPIPAAGYLGWVEDPNQERIWIFMRELTGERFIHEDSVHRVHAARWIGAFHSGAAAIGPHPGLPAAGARRYLQNLRRARGLVDTHRHNPKLLPGDVEFLEILLSWFDEVEGRWDTLETVCANAPQTLIHGDFNGKNIFVQSGAHPRVVVFDYEYAGWGPPSVDLAQFPLPDTRFAANPDLATYCDAVRDVWPELDRDAVERLANCGTVFRLLAVLEWETSGLAYEWARGHVATMRMLEADLTRVLRQLDAGQRSPGRYEVARR